MLAQYNDLIFRNLEKLKFESAVKEMRNLDEWLLRL